MIRLFFIGLLMIILTQACIEPTVRTIWSKPGGRQADFAQDKSDCEMSALNNTTPGLNEEGKINLCLENKGWARYEEPIIR